MDLLTLLISVAFFVPFAASIRRYVEHRGSLELAVVLVFSSTAALFAVAVVDRILPAIAPYASPIAVALLVAQPVLMLRLVGLFVGLSRWTLPAAVAGFGISIALYYATNRSVASILLLIGYFAVTELVAALALIADASRRQGFPRLRLVIAGIASILFGLSVFIAGGASAARGGADAGPAVMALTRLIALLAGLGYVAAFVPPRWLREFGHRALAFDLVRSIVASPTGTDQRLLWHALAVAAGRILGTPEIHVETPDGVRVGDPDAHAAIGPPPATAARSRSTTTIRVPLVSEGRLVAVLAAELAERPLFLEDDLKLIELLGSLTARAVEREEAVARLADATRQVGEAAAVRASEARFRALLDAEPNAMLSLDPDGLIGWATRSAARMFGVAEPDLNGLRFDALVASSLDRQATTSPADTPHHFESTATASGGRTFPVEVTLTDVEFDGAHSRLAVVSDVTWRHEEGAMRDRFIGVLSHELRTPITSIYGGTQLLLHRAGLDGATRDELLGDVAAESERLLRIIENLLVLARIERGADVADIGPVMLHRILPEVAEREHAMWPNLSLTLDIPGSLPLVAGDEASISLVLRNLISNAAKYAGADANVQVEAAADPTGAVAVRVTDDGPGIDPGEAEDLYTLYFRSKASAGAPGSGIGLFVCRQLVEAMGGRTWAIRAAGGGAEFGFTLPGYADEDRAVDGLPDRAQAAG